MDNILDKTRSTPYLDPSWNLRPLSMDLWSGVWSAFADIKVLHPRTSDGVSYWRGLTSGEVAGARVATGCQLVHHTRRMAMETSAVVAVHRIVDGFAAVESEDKSFVHRPGYITITDFQHEYRASHHKTVGEMLIVPRTRLGLPDTGPFSPVMLQVDSAQGKMLRSEFGKFFEAGARSGEIYDTTDLSVVLRAVLRQHYNPTSDREEWWYARKSLIRKYIETHLDDPNLGPAQICHLFNTSRATLYRMYESDGGVRRFIQDRRLQSAIWDLANGGIKRGRLSQVAERWGFSSDANFNRAAKLAFGMPPGALFKRGVDIQKIDMRDRSGEFPVYDWFERLKASALV